ncbi:MAG: hypothetical protein HUU55_10455 [Myxococcales bacterium]|nr:hypothetical protein [Myxococcales bacterium]
MGEIIGKRAAVDDIYTDINKTYAKAKEWGGIWQQRAEEKLAAVLGLAGDVKDQLDKLEPQYSSALAKLTNENNKADKTVLFVQDLIYNETNRQAVDPYLSILFPDGASIYTDVDVMDQPDSMEVLAFLIENNLHPLLPTDKAKEYAATIRTAKDQLQAAVDAARPIISKHRVLTKSYQALARRGQMQLSALKRMWKADGHSEATIHEVIPDRPTT